MNDIEQIMKAAPVIPVLVVEDLGQACEYAEALVEGGLRVLEVTLRTRNALEAITRMSLITGAMVGAGTVANPHQLEATLDAGSSFIVSPGLTASLGVAAIDSGVPFLPGAATASDIMRGLELGLTHFKFFPAMAAGGIPALTALAAPFRQCRFCPTGGISAQNAAEWLQLEFVYCVGGSWLVPEGASPEEVRNLAMHMVACQAGNQQCSPSENYATIKGL